MKNFKVNATLIKPSTIKILGLFLLFVLLNTSAQATYTVIGCTSDDTGYLYTGPTGVNSPRGYGPAYNTTPVVTTGQIGTGIYCEAATLGNCVIRTRSQCRDCTGPYDYDTSRKGTDWWYEQAGKLKGYVMCPIDDYVGLMLAAIGGLGFFVIRKNFLPA